MIRYFVPLIIVLVLGIFFWKGLSLDPRRLPSTLIDKPAPTFQNELKGQVSILNVWASWCSSCRQEHSTWMEIYARYPKIKIYGLNYKDQPEKATAWLKELGNPYAEIKADPTGRIAMDWGVYGTPETFVIDKQGIIRYKHVGPMNAEVFGAIILPLIKKLEAAP